MADSDQRRASRSVRFQQYMLDRAERSIVRGTVIRLLAICLLLLAVISGVLMWLIDRRDFPSIGVGVWWAIVTLATVGYGDFVPTTGPGRIVASFVILVGVTGLAVLTATVTSYFVSAKQDAREKQAAAARQATGVEDVHDLLREVLARLDANEAQGNGPSPGPPT
ncbi:MAG: Ion transport 2 domain protein [Acidimicrobiales bacterium]|nr:Ion transport 2 domain protein [Acidimicrobiales bacterium]